MTRDREPLASADVAWLRMDRPTNRMMITGVLMFDDVIPFEELRSLVTERLLVLRRFRQYVADPGGTPAWTDDPHFDLSNHLHHVALPEPGDQAALQDFVSDLMSAPLDLSRPLWDMHLVDRFGAGCAVVARLHHCIGDGIALIHVLMSLADEHFDPEAIPDQDAPAPPSWGLLSPLKPVAKLLSATAQVAGTLYQESAEVVRRPAHLFDRMKQGMSLGAAASKFVLLSSDTETRFRGEVGVAKRAAWTRPVPIDDVRAVARGFDAKMNDVLMAAVAGGLRRYLAEKGDPTEGIEVRAVVPVNLRPLRTALELGNRFGLVFLALPVGTLDPAERLREVKRRMDRIKYSSEAVVAYGVLQTIGTGPEPLQEQVVRLLSDKATAVLTNVPGPKTPLHLGRHTVRHIMFWVPRAGSIGLGVSIKSYAGEVLVGVATDAGLVPDPDALVRGFHDEFDALLAWSRETEATR